MADLAQALSEIKSLPDVALRHALAKPDGTIPGFLALSELHERKRIRASSSDQAPTERPSMAQEYMGMDSAKLGFASGGAIPKGMMPEGLANRNMVYQAAARNPRSMYNQAGSGGIVDLLMPGMPAAPVGPDMLEPQAPGIAGIAKMPQMYANGGIVGLAQGGSVYYNNRDAIRRYPVDPQLYANIQRGVESVYGPGYRAEIFSGGQDQQHRTGSIRHNIDPETGFGRAADVRIYSPEGNVLGPDRIAPFGGWWREQGLGGVGMGHRSMAHVDNWTTPPPGGAMTWDYGGYTEAQKAALQGQAAQNAAAQSAGGYDWANIQNSIANIESAGSGGYSALGPETNGDRPYGRYQIMGNNIGPWTEQHLGTRMTADQFLANQQAQDAVFQKQFGQYINKYGLEGAAQAWLGGPGSVGNTGNQDILGTSVGEYGQRFMAGLNNPANNQTAMAAAGTAGAANAVSQAAAQTGADMAAADGGMGDMMMMMSLLGGGAKAPAPAMGGGMIQQPVAPIDPRQIYRQPVPVRRFA